MSDLRELYQEVIIDHSKSPRNFCKMEAANHHAEGFNPLCGDKLSLYLDINDNGIIKDASFQGCGCAISTASASLMTDAIKDMPIQAAHDLFKSFHEVITMDGMEKDLGKLNVLLGVKEFPMRVKCATLAWHTLEAALENKHDLITTE